MDSSILGFGEVDILIQEISRSKLETLPKNEVKHLLSQIYKVVSQKENVSNEEGIKMEEI